MRTISLASLVFIMGALASACGEYDGSSGGPPPSFRGGGTTGDGTPLPSAGQLTAGEHRDLDDWPAWLDLIAQPFGFHTERRVAVEVTSHGAPAIDVRVTLTGQSGVAWVARTDNHGRAELFGRALGGEEDSPYTVTAESPDGATAVAEVPGIATGATPL